MAQLLEAGVSFVTRARGSHVLEHQEIQGVLAHPPTARVTRVKSDEVVELFDGGWLQLDAGLPQTRVLVARHHVPAPGKRVSVGKCLGEWVYELFITTLPVEGFLVEEVFDLSHGRGAFEGVRASEELEEDPDRWCSYTACGQEVWQVACQWVWNLRLALGQGMQAEKTRQLEWAPAKAAPAFVVPEESPAQEYGPRPPAAVGRATGRLGADSFLLQEDATRRCAAGAKLWLSQVRQENAGTEARLSPSPPTWIVPTVSLENSVWGEMPKAIALVAKVAVRRLLPSPSSVEHNPHLLQAMRWGPPQLSIMVAGVPAFLASK